MAKYWLDGLVMFCVGLLLGGAVLYVTGSRAASPPTVNVSTAAPVTTTAESREALRREVIAASEAALNSPCDVDRRARFQAALRDYARGYGAAPTLFTTPRDNESVRAIAIAGLSGLISAPLVSRWQPAERGAIDALLRRHGLDLKQDITDACERPRIVTDAGPAMRR